MAKLTRDSIIRTYILALGENPFSSVSLSMVAKKLDVSKTALYRHFRSKDDLVAAAKERMDADAAFLTLRKEGESNEDWMLRAGRLLLERFRDYPHYAIALARLETEGYAFPLPLVGQDPDTLWRAAVAGDLIVTGITSGRIRSEDGLRSEIRFISRIVDDGLGLPYPSDCSWAAVGGKEIGDHPYMDAIDDVVRKYGFRDLTAKRYAEELDIAPSSLYCAFPSLRDMVEESIRKEARRYYGLLEKRMARVQTLSDAFAVSAVAAESYIAQQSLMAAWTDGVAGCIEASRIAVTFPAIARFCRQAEELHEGLGSLLLTLPILCMILTYGRKDVAIGSSRMLQNLFHGTKEIRT